MRSKRATERKGDAETKESVSKVKGRRAVSLWGLRPGGCAGACLIQIARALKL